MPTSNAPYCKTGYRRCPISKQCVKKRSIKTNKCKKGTLKCSNKKCYNRSKSVKFRRAFYKKYA